MGLTKGNGVIINSSTTVSCAHVFIDDTTSKVFQIRCFANGFGSFGIIKTTKNDIFEKEDVAFSKIMYFSEQQIN